MTTFSPAESKTWVLEHIARYEVRDFYAYRVDTDTRIEVTFIGGESLKVALGHQRWGAIQYFDNPWMLFFWHFNDKEGWNTWQAAQRHRYEWDLEERERDLAKANKKRWWRK